VSLELFKFDGFICIDLVDLFLDAFDLLLEGVFGDSFPLDGLKLNLRVNSCLPDLDV
jgi:hypothetical protein